MSVEKGAYLGRVRNVEELRQRCYVDQDTGCWHYKQANSIWLNLKDGRKIVRKVRRASRIVKNGMKDLPRGICVFPAPICHSAVCANPAHNVEGTHSQAFKEHSARGSFSSPERIITLRKSSLERKKRTPEMDRAILNENGSNREIAAKYGISPSTVKVVRRGGYAQKVVTDVFSWRPQ